MNRLPNGDKEWISPCGRRYVIPPQRRLSPAFLEAGKNSTGAPEDPKNWDSPLAEGDDDMPF